MIQENNLIPQFALYLRNQLRRSQRTCNEYTKDLYYFVAWSAKYSTPLPIESVSESIINAYVASMAESGLAASTIHRRLSCIRSFYKWLSLHLSIDIQPAARVIGPRISSRLVQPADEVAVRQYLMTPTTTDKQFQVRFAVLMMYACGLRLSEVLSLRGSDFDFSRCVVHIIGKGNKERLCAFDTSFLPDVLYFVGGSTDLLFDHPNEATFRWAIINAIRSNGRGVHPHQLRHLFACRCLENGMPLKSLSLIMGHASVKTTERYLNMNRSVLAEMTRLYAPTMV